MSEEEDRISSEAAAWHAAAAHDDMDWEAFTAWLEADPCHSRVYDQVALADALLDEHRVHLLAAGNGAASSSTVEPAPIQPRAFAERRNTWARWAGAAIAASLAAFLLAPQFLDKSTVYKTNDKPLRVTLAEGSAVTLAPHSRLTISGSGRDRLALEGGAWFDVRHDPGRTLAITAGEVEIRDIGTSFDVQAEAGTVRVGVVEGEVTVASEALSQPIQLEHGRGLLFDRGDGTALVKPLASAEIGTWRSGRLSYEDTPLPLVLNDLSRYAGVRVGLPNALRSRRFSGSLIIGDGETAIRDLAEVMDLQLGRDGNGYRLVERSR